MKDHLHTFFLVHSSLPQKCTLVSVVFFFNVSLKAIAPTYPNWLSFKFIRITGLSFLLHMAFIIEKRPSQYKWVMCLPWVLHLMRWFQHLESCCLYLMFEIHLKLCFKVCLSISLESSSWVSDVLTFRAMLNAVAPSSPILFPVIQIPFCTFWKSAQQKAAPTCQIKFLEWCVNFQCFT